MTEWMETGAWPDWYDTGRIITMEDRHGKWTGVLIVDDVIGRGENEIPIFMLRLDDRTKHSFAGQDRWRFDTMRYTDRNELRTAAAHNFPHDIPTMIYIMDLIDGEHKNDPQAVKAAMRSALGD